jgi:hypothetical protein
MPEYIYPESIEPGSEGQVLKTESGVSTWADDTGATGIAYADLTDVDLTSLANGKVPVWDAVAGKWKPGSVDPTADTPLVFNFASPATLWTAVHNLGTKAVNVDAFDAGNDLMDVEVDYPDNNTVTVKWFSPSTGYLRLYK